MSITNFIDPMATIPPPALPPEIWAPIDASTFKVRGLTYGKDRIKTSSTPSLFKLVAVDHFETPHAIQNICSHPNNRVKLALDRGETNWIFAFNIMVPGPPFYCFVVYLEGDPVTNSTCYIPLTCVLKGLLASISLLFVQPWSIRLFRHFSQALFEEDTPFGRVAKKFFSTNDDEYRNNKFKLIPKIVEGNMFIKMAVKDTPTLLGNKLKQYYHKVRKCSEMMFLVSLCLTLSSCLIYCFPFYHVLLLPCVCVLPRTGAKLF